MTGPNGSTGPTGPTRAPTGGSTRVGAWSVRLRLTVLTAALLAVALAVGALAFASALARARVAELDEIVRQRALVVAALVTAEQVPEALPVAEPGEVAQVLDADGRVVTSSPNASRTLPVLRSDELAGLRARAVQAGTDGAAAVLVTGTTSSAYDGDARVGVAPATYQGEPVTVVATLPLAEVHWLRRAVGVSLAVGVPVLTLLLAGVVWVVVGRVLAPVEALRGAAAQVARRGGPGSLPVPRGKDELGALARTLNEMLDRLEAASARQRAFVADAAHELRSPIAALRAAVDVARAHPDAYSSAELAEALDGEVSRMQSLVDDLLLLARVGSAPTEPGPLDLHQLAAEAAEAAHGAPSDRVAVAVTGAGDAWGDHPALVRVVRNLVENAARHARATVVVTVADGVVTVDDDGAGIAAADRDRVFERFVRLEEAREREAGGSGLGLAIAREIARENGGEVRLGDAPSGGLRATVTLPTEPPRSPPG